ncbi:hypothetical protein CAPTEDRAFT_204622 [Capitella teleta]|uniref:C-type lectin domain-containing protein n=1 Tax=Capitella teleta TaxID=283909 RepID=R7USY1_CAPTE|nr:hypothetical protein CAPTEDRAFT_204622 [Capitella teleta]|eukprot:ELU07017.1 hypothetical protein CAPTEDRAFT_204622 [Capitella teleta]
MTAAWIGLWKAKEDKNKADCDLSCRRQGWTWSGKSSVSSKMEPKWAQDEPTGGHPCARLENTGEWWDKQCSHKYNYICEKPILHQPTPAAGMPDAPTTIEGNSESRQPQNTSETTSEKGSPNNLPIIIGAAVGGVLLGVLITGIVFIVVYRRKKRNRQIERGEPTKHRSGLSAQNNPVVSGYDSKATYVNEIPCVALATAERTNKASYVNGFDVNALTNERKKRKHEIKRSEPTKHRSGLSAQDIRVVSEYDSKATYVNKIPCVALATAKQPDKDSDVNGFDVNALTNEYDNPAEKKKTANQNTSTSNDDGAYATMNEIETSFPDVIPKKTPAVKATSKPRIPTKPKFLKFVSTESVESIAGSVGSMGSMGSVGSIATECGSVEQLYAVVDKSKKKKKQTNEEIEQMYAKPMKKSKNDFSSDEK